MPIVLSLLMLILAGPAQAQSPIRHGRALAVEFCRDCHAIGRRDGSRRAGAPPLREIGRNFDLDSLPVRLIQGISAAHPAMPEFRFRPGDARDLRDYLRTIQR